jgi:hypothetical protein
MSDWMALCPQTDDRADCGLFSRPQRCDAFSDGSIKCCIPLGEGTTVRPGQNREESGR